MLADFVLVCNTTVLKGDSLQHSDGRLPDLHDILWRTLSFS